MGGFLVGEDIMIIFEKASPENTPVAIKLAIKKAKEISTDIILASSSGASASSARRNRQAE